MFNEMTFNFIGHVGDAKTESRQGHAVSRIRVAATDWWYDSEGERQERTHWFQITSFSETVAKLIADGHLTKGRYILARGDIRENRWTDSEDKDRFDLELIAQRIDFLDPKAK